MTRPPDSDAWRSFAGVSGARRCLWHGKHLWELDERAWRDIVALAAELGVEIPH